MTDRHIAVDWSGGSLHDTPTTTTGRTGIRPYSHTDPRPLLTTLDRLTQENDHD